MLPPKPLPSHQATLLPLPPIPASFHLVKPCTSFNAHLRGCLPMKPPGQDGSPSPECPHSALFSVPRRLQAGAPEGQKQGFHLTPSQIGVLESSVGCTHELREPRGTQATSGRPWVPLPSGNPASTPDTRPDFIIFQMFPRSEAVRPGHKHKVNYPPTPMINGSISEPDC